MDDKLFVIFSEETEVPECVLRRVDETLEMIENSAKSDRGYQKEEKTGKVINGTDRMGKIGTRKNWKRSLILTFAAVMAFGATVFAAEKYIGISGFFQEVGNKMPISQKCGVRLSAPTHCGASSSSASDAHCFGSTRQASCAGH